MPQFPLSPRWLRPCALALVLAAAPTFAVAQQPTPVVLNGRTYVNQGLVGVGRIPAATKDKYNETFGSYSAFAFQPGTWKRNADGSYSGVLFTQPDRGYNAANTTNYTPRFNKLAVTFRPAPGGAGVQTQVGLTISDSVLFTESNGTPLTSLDPTASGSGTRTGFPALPQAFNGRLSLDPEGIIVNRDGTLWISDEYGPYVYKFAADGKLLAALRPPAALIPIRGGVDSFSSNSPGVSQPTPSPTDPVTGRQNNQGLEGLAISPDGRTLFALLQSATRQDGGTGGSGPRRNTRLLAWDITGATPTLTGEWVVQLPTYLQGNSTRVAAQSELLAISSTQFLVLARDGSGHGNASITSLYRSVVLYDIIGATNILGTAYDTAATPIAPGGVLVAGITPAATTTLIDINTTTELAKFGLHNGAPDDANNLSEKWEALAIVPAFDPSAPDDWFLFVGNDNDFLTTNGFQDGTAYNAGVENDSVMLVYRLTLPTRVLNVSSRARVGSGADAHIVGFIVSGTRPKALLVRAVGPTLTNFGVTGQLADPVLTVFSGPTAIASNDDWGNDAAVTAATTATSAFALGAGSTDAALVLNLDPGSYTAIVTGKSGATGIALAEVYEVP